MNSRTCSVRLAARRGWILLLPLMGCANAEGLTVGAPAILVAEGATTPTLAQDPHGGGALVAWVERTESEANVYLARVDSEGKRIGTPVRVNSSRGDASTHEQAPPQAAVGPAGEVYVVWQTSRPVEGRRYDASDLRFSWSLDGGTTFAPAITVNDDAHGRPSSHTFHNIAVGPDGRVYVSWLDSREQDRVRAELNDAGETHAGHGHAGGAPGNELPGSDIRVASWTPGAHRFSPGTVVDGDVCPCCRTSLAVARDGTVYVAWRKVFEGNVRDVVVARSADEGRSFTLPLAVHQDGWVFDGCPHAGPSIALDAAGRVFVAWYTGREGAQGLFYAIAGSDGRFGEPHPLLTDEWVPPAVVSLAPARGGGVWAAWDDRRGETRQVQIGHLDGSVPRLVGAPVAGSSPSLAGGESGAATLVWLDGDALRVRGLLGSPR